MACSRTPSYPWLEFDSSDFKTNAPFNGPHTLNEKLHFLLLTTLVFNGEPLEGMALWNHISYCRAFQVTATSHSKCMWPLEVELESRALDSKFSLLYMIRGYFHVYPQECPRFSENSGCSKSFPGTQAFPVKGMTGSCCPCCSVLKCHKIWEGNRTLAFGHTPVGLSAAGMFF